MNPNPHTPLELADAFLRAGELPDALAALDAHLAGHPDDADARRLRIDVLLHLPDRARDALVALDALPEPSGEDRLRRLTALAQLGEADGSEIGAVGDPALTEALLARLYSLGAVDPALRLLADLPKTWGWLRWSGDFYALKGDFTVAAEHFCSALEQLDHIEPNPLVAAQKAALLLKRAAAYHRLKQYAAAEADYLAAEAIIPDDPMIPFNRGLVIFEQGNLRRALPLCRDALDHAPRALRDHMRDVLFGDPRYHMLAQALMA